MTVEGFKFFQDAEGFSAFDINAFLMSQSVTRFDNSTDRDTALSSVLSEGMVSYDKSTNVLQFYDGSAWQTLALINTDHGGLSGLADDDHPQYLTEARGDLLYAAVDVSPTITLAGDATGSVTLTNLGDGTLTVTVANDSHTHDTRYFTETEADGRYVNVSGDTMTGTLTYTLLNGPAVQTRDKIRVWNNGAYTIGMQSGYTYGHLGDYAMSFQMNNDSDRGFWWGDDAHSNAQGAMSLTTAGRLTVATSLSVGQGESITGPSTETLYVHGNMSLQSGNNIRPSIYRVGGVYFTWDSDSYGTNSNHSIRSTNGDTWTDAITINSYGNIRMNIDSNNNGTNTFSVGQGTTGTGNTIFTLDESGVLTISAHLRCNEVHGDNGAANDPSFTFASDTDTGMYRVTTNQVGFCTGGALRGRFYSGGMLMGGASTGNAQIGTGTGSATAPVYHFYGDTNTGVYRSASDQLTLTAGGTACLSAISGTVITGNIVTNTLSGYRYVVRNSTFGTYYYYSSSEEYKEQINTVTGSGAIIDALRPVTFIPKFLPRDPTPDDHEDEFDPTVETDAQRILREADLQYGFIAEEVAQVADGKLAQYEWTDDGQLKPNGWKWPDIIAVLTAEVQSLRARVATLETQ